MFKIGFVIYLSINLGLTVIAVHLRNVFWRQFLPQQLFCFKTSLTDCKLVSKTWLLNSPFSLPTDFFGHFVLFNGLQGSNIICAVYQP